MDYRIFNMYKDVNACDCTQGCTDTERESAPKVVSGKKIPCCTGESNLCQRHDSLMLYQLSCIPSPAIRLKQVQTANNAAKLTAPARWELCNEVDELLHVASARAALWLLCIFISMVQQIEAIRINTEDQRFCFEILHRFCFEFWNQVFRVAVCGTGCAGQCHVSYLTCGILIFWMECACSLHSIEDKCERGHCSFQASNSIILHIQSHQEIVTQKTVSLKFIQNQWGFSKQNP